MYRVYAAKYDIIRSEIQRKKRQKLSNFGLIFLDDAAFDRRG